MRTSTLAVLVVVLGFVGFLIYSAMRQGKTECEVCIGYAGQSVCRSAAAGNRKDAAQAATTAACAVMASGVTDTVQCQQTPPSKFECRDR